MCGRARVASSTASIISRYDPVFKVNSIENCQPSMETPVIFYNPECNKIQVKSMIWGLIPSFTNPNSKLDHFLMFNARSESVHEKVSFRKLIRSKRCIVIVDGFYEWKTDEGGSKQPYYIFIDSSTPMYMAGIYDEFVMHGKSLYSYSILTTTPNNEFLWLHNRLPVLLHENQIQEWINPASDPTLIYTAHPSQILQIIPVTKQMNKITYQGDDCSHPIEIRKSNVITKYFQSPMKGQAIVSNPVSITSQSSRKTKIAGHDDLTSKTANEKCKRHKPDIQYFFKQET